MDLLDIKCGDCSMIFTIRLADQLKRPPINGSNRKAACPNCGNKIPENLWNEIIYPLVENTKDTEGTVYCKWEIGTRFTTPEQKSQS